MEHTAEKLLAAIRGAGSLEELQRMIGPKEDEITMQEQDHQIDAESSPPQRRRPRKSVPADTPDYSYFGLTPRLTPDERRFLTAVEQEDVKTALRELERSQAVRDSISRKLCGGSNVVKLGDLSAAENALAGAKNVLVRLAKYNPILLCLPNIAFATKTANSDPAATN